MIPKLLYAATDVGSLTRQPPDRPDTCLVRYRIHNKDGRPHTVGLRFLLDTFVGDNDGVPFLLPGSQQLCSTSREFNSPAEVPAFLESRS